VAPGPSERGCRLATYVTTHTQIHRADLVSDVYAGSQLVQQRLAGLAATLASRGFTPDAAQRGAYALLDQQVNRQAAMLSYNDAWILLLLSFLAVSPGIFLLRKSKRQGATPAGAH
jgi:DHA2 family multidrug resistance protein